MDEKKNPAILIPDECGIIRAETIPVSGNGCTFRDLRNALWGEALYAESAAQDYIDTLPTANPVTTEAMQYIKQSGERLRALIDDPEINSKTLSHQLREKIYDMALTAHFIGMTNQLAQVAPILSKEQLERAILEAVNSGRAENKAYAATTAEKLDNIHRHTENIPPLIHQMETEEGRAIIKTDAMLKAVNCTPEERAVFVAWFNNGGRSLSQSEVSRKVKLSLSQVRRRAESFNKKAKDRGITICWKITPTRDRSAKARDKVQGTK